MPTPAPGRPATLCVLLCLLLSACSSGGSRPSEETSATAAASRSPAPTTAATGPEAQVAAALAGLDRRGQVAQLFVAGVPLDDLGSGEELVRGGVGGIFLAGRSTAAVADLAATTGRWQSGAPGPRLWVAADQEGGDVQALQGPGFDRLPPAVDQGDLPPDQLAALAAGIGASLRGAGVNLDLAPVVDVVPVDTEAANPPIGAFGRHYGNTAAEVTAAAGTIVDGLAAADVTATLKHFPGLGRVQANTDTAVEVVDQQTGADDEQVAAFRALTRSPAAPFVMPSSAIYPRLDPAQPAAFSPAVITGLLRGQLGFAGVVISDDLGNAAAVQHVSAGERAVRFLAAGGTLVLTVDPTIVPEMIDAVLERSAADPAFAAVVDDAVHTALLAKADAGLLPPA